MTKKVKVAIFDRDLKARTFKSFPVSDDGSRIRINPSGKGYFAPKFDNDSYIELPRRSLLMPWKIVWDRIYFVRRGADTCVNFRTGEVPGPDPELVKMAAGTELLKNLGREKPETPVLLYIIFFIVLLILLKVMGVIR